MEFHVDFARLADVISYPVLALGVGNLFWTPTAICFGKRPVTIASMVMFLVFCIWSIYARTLDELVAARVLACFGMLIQALNPHFRGNLKSYMETNFGYSCWKY